MITIGLTGSIGMGKSAVSDMFRREGVPVFDADATVHILQGPTGSLLPAIEARFPGTTTPDGVDRQKLGAAVFGKQDELRALERIVHPAVAGARRHWLQKNRSRPLVVLDIPLLFEKKGWKSVDIVVVVSAPAWMQRKRVLARPGMTTDKFRRVMKVQMPDSEKRRRADIVIETGCLRTETEAQLRSLVACLRAKRSG